MKNEIKKLHLGCGNDIKKGFVNLDSIKLKGVDVIHDLNKFPWPFKDNTFDFVLTRSTLEHLEDIIKIMEEINRICKDGAIVEITVPHFSSLGAYRDPTHKHFFTYYSFDYFTKDFDYNFYTKSRFEIVERKIIYGENLKLLEFIANKFPRLHEICLRKILPVQDLYFKLKVIKK